MAEPHWRLGTPRDLGPAMGRVGDETARVLFRNSIIANSAVTMQTGDSRSSVNGQTTTGGVIGELHFN